MGDENFDRNWELRVEDVFQNLLADPKGINAVRALFQHLLKEREITIEDSENIKKVVKGTFELFEERYKRYIIEAIDAHIRACNKDSMSSSDVLNIVKNAFPSIGNLFTEEEIMKMVVSSYPAIQTALTEDKFDTKIQEFMEKREGKSLQSIGVWATVGSLILAALAFVYTIHTNKVANSEMRAMIEEQVKVRTDP